MHLPTSSIHRNMSFTLIISQQTFLSNFKSLLNQTLSRSYESLVLRILQWPLSSTFVLASAKWYTLHTPHHYICVTALVSYDSAVSEGLHFCIHQLADSLATRSTEPQLWRSWITSSLCSTDTHFATFRTQLHSPIRCNLCYPLPAMSSVF